MQQLKNGTTLQGGKYRIISVLGRGGFGITYLAENTMLDGKVAIKEFFFKEYCNRDEETSHVTVPTDGNREIVERFKMKFIKEARTIFKLNHPNIVRIFDIFEENGTAYYVMDYIEGESLNEMVKHRGAIAEATATRYILKAAEALEYIHKQNMNHLDIKPANIMINGKDESVLIDFGLSKQYDAGGQQTSTTPVGISEGYAPMEQYKKGGVGEFSPQTDIYALGATFFKLLTGKTPPSASDVNEDGLPVEELKAKGVSRKAIDTICGAMKSRKKDRMQNVRDFIEGLQGEVVSESEDDIEATVVSEETRKAEEEKRRKAEEEKRRKEAAAKRRAEEKAAPERKAREEAERKREEENKARRSKLKKIILWAVVAVVAVVGVGVLMNIPPSPTLGTSSYTPNIREFTVNGVSFQMVEVRGGTFTMGATSEQGDANDDEKPTHKVTLTDYYIGKTEVTQALWEAVMGNNPSYFQGKSLPVENISWNDCKTFIVKLNALTGKTFRMPTEAEWEYAARGGSKSRGYKYSGSGNIDEVAWHKDNSEEKTHEVGKKSPNELGLYDMSGNVWEWCNDWYGDYSSASQTNPKGPDSGANRIGRGGGWWYYARGCRCSIRGDFGPDYRNEFLGLRLCLFE